MKVHNDMGVPNPYKARGPWDVNDNRLGYRAAICMVLRSLDPRLYADYIQYETTRKMRSHVANFEHTTPGGVGAAFVGEEGRVSFLSNACTNSPWFRRFARGCHHRMGDIWIPDQPVTIVELRAALKLLEEDWVAWFQGKGI
mmetsp:Transcript_9223/g.14188  ORF Transcript_9223/g.14188 Transcript_9223/m.14188 type:complete len:142 (+) Transcript_9223:4966-5391(+)